MTGRHPIQTGRFTVISSHNLCFVKITSIKTTLNTSTYYIYLCIMYSINLCHQCGLKDIFILKVQAAGNGVLLHKFLVFSSKLIPAPKMKSISTIFQVHF